MPKHGVSVTLEVGNVTWLKGRAGATGKSVSEIVDRIVTAARKGTQAGPAQSVRGTIDIDSSDPLLENADALVQSMFEQSIARPLAVRERGRPFPTSRKGARNRRG